MSELSESCLALQKSFNYVIMQISIICVASDTNMGENFMFANSGCVHALLRTLVSYIKIGLGQQFTRI